jgi:hypothetical protein
MLYSLRTPIKSAHPARRNRASSDCVAAAQRRPSAAPPAMAPNFRVRTVTLFVKLPTDEAQWEPELAAAGNFLARAQAAFEALGETESRQCRRGRCACRTARQQPGAIVLTNVHAPCRRNLPDGRDRSALAPFAYTRPGPPARPSPSAPPTPRIPDSLPPPPTPAPHRPGGANPPHRHAAAGSLSGPPRPRADRRGAAAGGARAPLRRADDVTRRRHRRGVPPLAPGEELPPLVSALRGDATPCHSEAAAAQRPCVVHLDARAAAGAPTHGSTACRRPLMPLSVIMRGMLSLALQGQYA